MREVFGQDIDATRDAFAFAGDSPNDAPMFAYFPNAVGVANVRRFLGRIATPPAYITAARRGRRVRRTGRHAARRRVNAPALRRHIVPRPDSGPELSHWVD